MQASKCPTVNRTIYCKFLYDRSKILKTFENFKSLFWKKPIAIKVALRARVSTCAESQGAVHTSHYRLVLGLANQRVNRSCSISSHTPDNIRRLVLATNVSQF